MNKDWLHITGAASKVAKIKMHGVIGGDWFEEGVTAEQVESDLEEIANIKADTIEVDLASLGGSVMHGMKIYNLLKSNKANIEINVTGWTASMGTVIAMAADEGKLKMVDNNHFLVHEARTYTAGTKAQLEADAKFLDNINNDIADIYASRTGLSKEDALALMGVNGGEGEFWNASETLSKGFVDSTYKPEKGATASVTQNQLTEFKINAKININMEDKKDKVVDNVVEPVIDNKSFDLGDVTAKIVEAVKAAITPVVAEDKKEDKKEEVNIEELVSNEVAKEIVAINESKEAEMVAKVSELSDLQAKYDILKAGDSNASGADADLDGGSKTASDIAADQFKATLSDSDKLMFEVNAKK
tara:strand:- start:6116 stop:7192 length:1077 start_codon:yes stop_codon:yes gene_type:complete